MQYHGHCQFFGWKLKSTNDNLLTFDSALFLQTIHTYLVQKNKSKLINHLQGFNDDDDQPAAEGAPLNKGQRTKLILAISLFRINPYIYNSYGRFTSRTLSLYSV